MVPLLFQKDTCSDLLLSRVLSQQTFVGLQDVFKTYSRHIFRRLQHVFSVAFFCLPRRLQDVLKTSCKYVLKTSWKMKDCYAEDVLKTCVEDVLKTYLEDFLKTCLEDILKISWRQTKCLLGIPVSNHSLPANLNQYLANLYLINVYFTHLKRIPSALIRTQ